MTCKGSIHMSCEFQMSETKDALATDLKIDPGWKPGPPPGRGNWWIYWRHLDDSWHVDSCEVSPSLLRYYDPDAPLLLKLPHGACFPFDTAKEQISHHAPMERPEPPKLRRGRMRARAERDRQRRRPA